MTIELGRLERVEAREVWANEATHFTPWLAEQANLKLLGEVIGIELELEAQERSVGPFRADILCKNTATEDWVLIENQLEKTDHTHLGQLITYASGLKAVTIVWIANPFTEEHRAALDWLNEITDSRFNFFGLEVELWRIGDSNVAPKFNIAAKPNDWSKTVSEGVARVEHQGLTQTTQNQYRFWTGFKEFVSGRETSIQATKPQPQGYMQMSIGRTGFLLTAIASSWDSESGSYNSNEIRAQVELTSKNSKLHFQLLYADKEAIETEIGYPLVWYSQGNVQLCRIYVRETANMADESQWPRYFNWLTTHLEDLRRVFGQRIKQL